MDAGAERQTRRGGILSRSLPWKCPRDRLCDLQQRKHVQNPRSGRRGGRPCHVGFAAAAGAAVIISLVLSLAGVVSATREVTHQVVQRGASIQRRSDISLETKPSIAVAERDALLALYEAIGSPTLLSEKGWGSDATVNGMPCQEPPWLFITCKAGRVATLDLSYNNAGTYMDFNIVAEGTLPWEKMTALQKLESFTMQGHKLQSEIFPSAMSAFSSLTRLDLSSNKVSLPFTEGLTGLTALKTLDFYGNRILGPIPPYFSKLKNLELIDLSFNNMNGTLPAEIGNMTQLTGIVLSGNEFSGSMPESWSRLTNLWQLKLAMNAFNGTLPLSWVSMAPSMVNLAIQSNSFTGPFPAVLTNLTKLTLLHIETNKFYGPVPKNLFSAPAMVDISIEDNYFNGSTVPQAPDTVQFYRYSGNCFNVTGKGVQKQRPVAACTKFYSTIYPTPPPPPNVVYQTTEAPPAPSSSANLGLIIGVSVGVTVLAVVVMLLFLRCYRQERIARKLRKGVRQSTREFSLSELKTATKNWSTAVGRGGYGTVYKAALPDGTAVAVKRLDQVSAQGDEEFIREVELLSRVHHRHLVNLVGFCGEKGERALVYEYMSLGSLHDHLHGECAQEQPLSWDSRIKIAIHVAFGIDYLHYGADPPLIHRDIKSANILLSDEGYAKVADFGLCKEAPVGVSGDGTAQLVPQGTEVRGSFGYLDPEYVNTSVLSEKSDVYSYGVVLLELITGKRSIHDWQPLAYWAEPYLEDPQKIPQLVDPLLGDDYDLQELQILCDIARSCVYDQAARRPAIRDVAQALVENLGHMIASSASDISGLSSELASTNDNPSGTYSSSGSSTSAVTPSEYSFRNAASEALLIGWKDAVKKEALEKEGGGGGGGGAGGNGSYVVSTGMSGTRLPVPVGKREDTV